MLIRLMRLCARKYLMITLWPLCDSCCRVSCNHKPTVLSRDVSSLYSNSDIAAFPLLRYYYFVHWVDLCHKSKGSTVNSKGVT